MKSQIYQDKVELIGHFKKIDTIRVNTTGYSIYRFIIEIPDDSSLTKQIPCIIYGKEAEDLDKKVRAGDIRSQDILLIKGSHQTKLEHNNRLMCCIKVRSFEIIENIPSQQKLFPN
ncbi:MAG: hypothetical protein ACRCS8_00110 [Brevinema sp.]